MALSLAKLQKSIPNHRHQSTMLALLLLSSVAVAQPAEPERTSVSEPPAATADGLAVDVSVARPQTDVFEIPHDVKSIDQLMAFVDQVDSIEPSGSGEAEMVAHQCKVARTVVAAAEQVAAQQLSDEDAMQCVYFKLQGLRILKELDAPKAETMLDKAIAAARADKRPDVQAVGMKFMVEVGFVQWLAWGEKNRSEFIDQIVKQLSQQPPEISQIEMVVTIVDELGRMNGTKHAQQLIARLMPHFRSSNDLQIRQSLTTLAGVERRLNLPGNEIQLNGTLLDGSTLDWESYRGKVVLVDFWATWCQPCRAEVPNVLKMYRAYHDKGFEVLGISLDKTREEAESYIEQTSIPWPTMFSENPSERFWQHPMVVRYGINGIPRAILVDRDGKVVHMEARGENLGRELRRLLGEPVARVQKTPGALVQRVAKPAAEN